MSVRKRKTSSGRISDEYHYEFMHSRKRYYGVCENCTTEREALAFEKSIKKTVKKLSEQKSIVALVENHKQILIGGDEINLSEAFDRYLAKPSRKVPSVKQQGINRSQWNDFCAFITDKYPEINKLEKISKKHAEAYIKQLRDNGRYIETVQYSRKYNNKLISHNYKTQTSLSRRTINAFHKTLRSVFSRLQEDAGILYNPFDFKMMDNDSEGRDAFSPEELKLIGNNLNDFVKPIFVIGTCTGLSEGDICNLKWSEIHNGWITRKRHKTGVELDIPILPPLAKFLKEQHAMTGDGDYVLPEHAAMYKENSSGISYRVKSFLENLGIKTTKKVKGRGRAVSVKDVHSLRHTFAYMAGCYRIPLPIVQSILGHMSSDMTKHYQAHADRQAKEKYLAQMPNFLDASAPTFTRQIAETETERQELHNLADTLPIDEIKKILQYVSQ